MPRTAVTVWTLSPVAAVTAGLRYHRSRRRSLGHPCLSRYRSPFDAPGETAGRPSDTARVLCRPLPPPRSPAARARLSMTHHLRCPPSYIDLAARRSSPEQASDVSAAASTATAASTAAAAADFVSLLTSFSSAADSFCYHLDAF